jgi:EmrB/QacA subfamily drug resistance transporter
MPAKPGPDSRKPMTSLRSVRSPNGSTRNGDRAAVTAFSSMLLIIFLAAMDATIVATALPTIAADLGGSSLMGLVIAGFLLGTAISIPVWGKLADILPMRRLYMVAAGVFVGSSALIGFAPSMWFLIGARVIQGVGTGGLMALTPTIVGVLFPVQIRAKFQGIQGAVLASAGVVGPIVGGIVVDTIGWRWAFLFNVPLGVIGLCVVTTKLRLPERAQVHRKIDVVGATIIAIGVVCVLLTFGEVSFIDNTTIKAVLGVAALLCVTSYAWWQRRIDDPIVPLRLLANPQIRAGLLLGLTAGTALLVITIHIPTYAQVVTGRGAARSALTLLPLTIGVVLASILSGYLVTKLGRTKPLLVAGTILSLIGVATLSQRSIIDQPVASIIALFIVGAGTGLVAQPALLAVQNAADPSDLGAATAATAFFRQIGGTIAIGILAGLLAAKASLQLETLENGETLSAAGRDVVASAITRNLLFVVAVAAVGVIVALSIPNQPLEAAVTGDTNPTTIRATTITRGVPS